MSEDHIDFVGQSGKTYRYFFVDVSQPIDPVEANYVFARRRPDGKYRPIYFGETDNANERLGPSHERWIDAIAAGLTHVLAHFAPDGEHARRAEERDLVEYWQPELNVQHRQAK